MAIQKEIWVQDIIQNLFPDNEVLSKIRDEGDYVLDGKVVHIPQAGAKPVVVKNRSSLPATATKRTDTEISYVLDWYSTDPFHVQNAEEAELSYDKRMSILGEHIEGLREVFTDDLLIKFLTNAVAASKIIRTTGANTAATETGQTGTRKALTLANLKSAKTLMDKQNISRDGRIALLEPNMLDQLASELSTTQYRDFSERYDAKNGILGRIEGFDIMQRSFVGISNVDATAINVLGAAIGATNQVASILFQKDCLTKALGNVNIYHDEQNPIYYGDVSSADVRCGGRVRRANAEGVFALIQATGV